MKFLLLVMPTILLAAGSSDGHGSPTDLIPSFINVFILLSFLVWKLTPSIRDHFSSRSQEVDEIMKRAEVKAKEASEMMELTSKKMANSDSEIESLKTNAKNQIDNFKSDYNKDVESRITKLNQDAKMKIEAEKRSLSDSVNELLVDKVINNSKSKISSNNNLSQGTREVLLGDL